MQMDYFWPVTQLASLVLCAGIFISTHPAPATSALRIPPAPIKMPAPPTAGQRTRNQRAQLEVLLDRISASRKQREQINRIVSSYGADLKTLRKQLEASRSDFITNITQGKSPEAVMAKEAQLSKFTSSVEMQTSLMQLEIRKLLQPEQWRIFEDYWQSAQSPDN